MRPSAAFGCGIDDRLPRINCDSVSLADQMLYTIRIRHVRRDAVDGLHRVEVVDTVHIGGDTDNFATNFMLLDIPDLEGSLPNLPCIPGP